MRRTSKKNRWICGFAILFAGAPAFGSETRFVDVDGLGNPSIYGIESDAAISGDGRWVAFTSWGAGLVPTVPSDVARVYVRDMASPTAIALVSSAASGMPPSAGVSQLPSISYDGRYIAFMSTAPLVPNAPNGQFSVYLHDRVANVTECVAINEAGTPAWSQIQKAGSNVISADGRYVLFSSFASLVTGDIGTHLDVYVRDRWAQQTVLVTRTTSGVSGNNSSRPGAISADGTKVLFITSATNLAGTSGAGMYVKNLVTGVVQRVDVDSGGTPIVGATIAGDSTLSPDGNFVVFDTTANNPAWNDVDGKSDVYLVDLSTQSVEVVSNTMGGSPVTQACVDADVAWGGRYVTFTSHSNQIVPWDQNGVASDIVLTDRFTSRSILMNVSTSLVQGYAGDASFSSISDDGAHVVFVSTQGGLGASDTVVGSTDVFRRSRLGFASMGFGKPGATGIPQLAGAGSVAPGGSGTLTLSNAAPNRPGLLFLAIDGTKTSFSSGPFAGSVFVPANPVVMVPFLTSASGGVALPYTVPQFVLLAPESYLQGVIQDPTAFHGASMTNALCMGL